ncbi:MAG: hypothetical protein IIY58_06645 [Aeriscardovia sp.]|nr:hypothetical protein [Aeriscardovia sp.]
MNYTAYLSQGSTHRKINMGIKSFDIAISDTLENLAKKNFGKACSPLTWISFAGGQRLGCNYQSADFFGMDFDFKDPALKGSLSDNAKWREEACKALKPLDEANLEYVAFPSHSFGIHVFIPFTAPLGLKSEYERDVKGALEFVNCSIDPSSLFNVDTKCKDAARYFAEGAEVDNCDLWIIHHEGSSLSNGFNSEGGRNDLIFSTSIRKAKKGFTQDQTIDLIKRSGCNLPDAEIIKTVKSAYSYPTSQEASLEAQEEVNRILQDRFCVEGLGGKTKIYELPKDGRGFAGLVDESTYRDEVKKAIRLVCQGNLHIQNTLSRHLADYFSPHMVLDSGFVKDLKPGSIAFLNGLVFNGVFTPYGDGECIAESVGLPFPYEETPAYDLAIYALPKDSKFRHFLDFNMSVKDIARFESLIRLTLSETKSNKLIGYIKGPGSNGKTKFFTVLSRALGKAKVGEETPSNLTKTMGRFDRASHKDEWISYLNETDPMTSLNTQVLKILSENSISIEEKFKDPVTSAPYRPWLFLLSNHSPRFDVIDGGLKRRFAYFEWVHRFEDGSLSEEDEEKMVEDARKWICALMKIKPLSKREITADSNLMESDIDGELRELLLKTDKKNSYIISFTTLRALLQASGYYAKAPSTRVIKNEILNSSVGAFICEKKISHAPWNGLAGFELNKNSIAYRILEEKGQTAILSYRRIPPQAKEWFSETYDAHFKALEKFSLVDDGADEESQLNPESSVEYRAEETPLPVVGGNEFIQRDSIAESTRKPFEPLAKTRAFLTGLRRKYPQIDENVCLRLEHLIQFQDETALREYEAVLGKEIMNEIFLHANLFLSYESNLDEYDGEF